MKIMFSAGEASGDMHAAGVAKAIRETRPGVEMFGMGGSLMAAQDVRLVYDIKDLGYIGLVEIITALPKFFRLRDFLRERMMEEKPDVLVCVDYPGFNMRLAKVAHSLGIPVVYYIAPTIWAWHRSRGKDIAKYVTKVASIFPFEAEAYRAFGCDVAFVGHPLLDIVKPSMTKEEAYTRFGATENDINILLMPGSRLQEVTGLLDTMLRAVKVLKMRMPDIETSGSRIRCFLPRAHTIDRSVLADILAKYDEDVTITEGDTYDLMGICRVALAASGTATLETAMMLLPTILMYRVSPVTFFIGKRLVNLTHLGLPNIIAGREVIPELLQGDVTPERAAELLASLLTDETRCGRMRDDLEEVCAALGKPGALERVARTVMETASGGTGE